MSIKVLTYQEHERQRPISNTFYLKETAYSAFFQKTHRGKTNQQPCFEIKKQPPNIACSIDSSYFVGLDWLDPKQSAISIQPKLDNKDYQIDLFQMLHQALERPDALIHLDQLLQIDWKAPTIPVAQESDFLTPLLSISYLGILKNIVRKGLQKRSRPVQKNLHAKVKGKVLVSRSIKKNLMQHKASHTFCKYPEHGLNTAENALLKKALLLVNKNLLNRVQAKDQMTLANNLSYLNHAFKKVSPNVQLKGLKSIQPNHFYPEYRTALQMAQLIINYVNVAFNPSQKNKIQVPPYWIDMSKLFELYVLGLLKDRFHEKVQYQVRYRGNELDYLLNAPNYKMVVDAKYKPIYQTGKVKEDIRQLSGYARLNKVHQALSVAPNQKIDCLVVYPNQENGWDQLSEVNLKATKVKDYTHTYKLGVKLPVRKI
ncbi:MAG: hypothetical protein Sapg2KO_45750 [Saprospiraceae bacterium]